MGDSTAMTVEFLRARLLSERSVSRAARERTEQLAARVMELEGQLSIVTIQRKKAEKAASEVLAILETQEISDFSELIDLSPDGSVPYNDSRRAYESATASRMERSEDDGLSATEPEVFPSRDNSLAWKSHIKSDGKQMVNQIMQRQRWQSFMTTLQSSSEHQLGKSCRKIKQTDEGSARDCEKDKPTPLDAQGNGWVSCSNFRDDQPVDVEASRGMTEGAVADISDSHHVDSDHNRTTEGHLCGNGSGKDEDMERVLEKQAMLINQFQAEENAQREWEKKYNEKTISTLANYEPGNLLPESNSQSKKELSEFALRAVHISSTEATVESLPGSNKNDRSEEASNMTSSDGSMPKDTPTASSGRCSDGQESDFEHRQVGVVAKETKNISEKITASAHEHDGMIRNAKQKEATPHVASNAYPSNSRSRPHGNRARTIEGASSQINLLVDDHRKLLKLGPKQSQTPSSNLGGVLEALQRARLSLTQELRKKHSPSQGTSALAAPTSCPIGSATLFRLPTDSIPQPQQSRARFYASGSSFPAYRPGEEREGSSRAGKDCSQFDSNRVTTSAYGDPSPTPTYTEGGGSRVVAGREYTDNYFGTGSSVAGLEGINGTNIFLFRHSMLCHPPHSSYFFFLGSPRPNLNPNPNSINLHLSTICSLKPVVRATASDETSATTETLIPSNVSRRQNAKSTALFLLHSQGTAPRIDNNEQEEELDEDEIHRKKIIDEASLATKRVARFPGSIDFPKPKQFTYPIDLNRVVIESDDEEIKKALEVRRGVAAEILKEALKAGKLSINYSTNLVSRLSGFVDRVVIEAAAMKEISEFSHVSFNARAKSYIQSSGVVALVKWLKHNSMTYPQIGKVICMCSVELEQVRRSAEWLKSIHVKGENLGAVFVKASLILERSSEEMEEIVEYLIDNGVKMDWIGFVVTRCPQILTLPMEDLVSRVEFYLDMGMNKKDFGTMVYDCPRALGFFSFDEMNSKVQYLKEFGLNTEDLGRLLALKPQLMGCSIEERWKPLVKYLYYLGVRRDGMKRILMVKPMIFCVDLERTIAPKVRFLQDLGIREEAIGSAIVKFPPLLTYSLYKKIRPTVIFLITKAGVTPTNIAKVIAFDPQLIGCSIIKKLEIHVKYFLSLGIRMKSLGEMIADFPMLLRYNLDVIRPKYQYLRRVMVRPLHDLIEFPRFLSYSLEGRIIPRHKALVENRINFKLRYMLAGTDEQFRQRLEAAIENRRRFESGSAASDVSNSESSPAPPSSAS